jgi:hypothetical protein
MPETEIIFRLPSIRIQHIRAGHHRMGNQTAMTPVDAPVTGINHRIYWMAPEGAAPVSRMCRFS